MEISDKIALGALIISFLSLGFSIAAISIQKKLNTTNLQAIYYEEIFKDYLVKKIPNAARKLTYVNGKLGPSYKQISEILLKMVDDSAYFAYANHEFYAKLRELYTELDDKLGSEAGKNWVSLDSQKMFIYSVNEDIMEIVKFINKNYSYCK